MVSSVAYAVGLLLADIMAVVLRKVVAGQPALMYIVPSILLSITFFAKSKNEFQDLWHEPKCMKSDENHQTQPLLSE